MTDEDADEVRPQVGMYMVFDTADLAAEACEGNVFRMVIKLKDPVPEREVLLNLQVHLDAESHGHICNYMRAVSEAIQAKKGAVAPLPAADRAN